MTSKKSIFFMLAFSLMVSQAAIAQENMAESSESGEETIGEVVNLPCGAHYVIGNPEDVETNSNSSVRIKTRTASVDNQ